VVILLAGSLPSLAHHSPSAEFDVTRRMTLSGTLAKIDWVNPHIVVFSTRSATALEQCCVEIRKQPAGVVPPVGEPRGFFEGDRADGHRRREPREGRLAIWLSAEDHIR
jgi:hypothetical protein